MAAVNLNDGVNSTSLKYLRYIEAVPGVDQYFLNRLYNATDSELVRSRGTDAALRCRQTMVTYQIVLRKLAKRLCLDKSIEQTDQQVAEITRTRAFLGNDFFQHMGFYGVEITRSAGEWTFTEIDAQDMADAHDNVII